MLSYLALQSSNTLSRILPEMNDPSLIVTLIVQSFVEILARSKLFGLILFVQSGCSSLALFTALYLLPRQFR